MEFAELYLSLMPWVISFILSALVLLCSRRYILSHFGRSSLAILFLVLAFAIHASGSKPLRSPARIASGMQGAIVENPVVPQTNDVASSFLSADCSWVSNLCVAGIHRSTNATDLLVAWTPSTAPVGDVVSVFVSTSLVSSWSGYADYDVLNAVSNAVLRIPDLGWLSVVSPVAFYAIGDLSDRDCDGLSDAYEIYVTKTNPREPDTDLDGLNDGWELSHGMNPSVANTHSGDDCRTCAADDPDHDGLTNGEEVLLGTDPFNADTDGDGIPDGVEVNITALRLHAAALTNNLGIIESQPASSPARSSARSGGAMAVSSWSVVPILTGLTNPASSENSMFEPVVFLCGDPSISHSEKYELSISPVPGSGIGPTPDGVSLVNSRYGVCDLFLVFLRKGWRYEVKLRHVSTNLSSDVGPDPDYVLIGAAASGTVVESDPDGLFGVLDVRDGEFAGNGKTAVITLYAVTDVLMASPDDGEWGEIDVSRVLLDDEALRARIDISPSVPSLDYACGLFGESLVIATDRTCPNGAMISLRPNAWVVNETGKSEIRMSLTRDQLRQYGLIPVDDEDGVDEMAWLDMADIGQGSDQNIDDSIAFEGMGYQDGGRAYGDPSCGLDSAPPISSPSESYFKAAGREIVEMSYGGVASRKRQVMNQSDYFYYSGHGIHSDATLNGGFTPSMAAEYWNRDLNCVILAACSVLDIGDRGRHFQGTGDSSPGLAWEQTGPALFLGYSYKAPGDAGGAPARIMNSWTVNRESKGDVDAWLGANCENHAWNACAIVKNECYYYLERLYFGARYRKRKIRKEEW